MFFPESEEEIEHFWFLYFTREFILFKYIFSISSFNIRNWNNNPDIFLILMGDFGLNIIFEPEN